MTPRGDGTWVLDGTKYYATGALGAAWVAVAAVVAWAGIIGGDCVLYYLGRRFGLNITKLPVIGKL